MTIYLKHAEHDLVIAMILKEFVFILRSAGGVEYEMAVPSRSEEDAERLLKNLLDTLESNDRIVSLKKGKTAY